jgi:hypothetical protein
VGSAEGGGLAASSLRAMLQQALVFKEVEGVRLSALDGCALIEGNSGVWLRPSRMTIEQVCEGGGYDNTMCCSACRGFKSLLP